MIETLEKEENKNETEMKDDEFIEIFNKFKKIKLSGNPKFQKIDTWLEKEANLYLGETKNRKRRKFKYKRGTIVKVNFGVNPGSELCHTHFAIVLNNDDNIAKDTVTVVPLSSKPGVGRIPLNNLITEEIIKSIKKQMLKIPTPNEEDTATAIELINEYRKYTNFSYALISQITAVSKSRMIFSNNKYDIINKSRCSKAILEEIDNAIIKTMTGVKLIEHTTEKVKI